MARRRHASGARQEGANGACQEGANEACPAADRAAWYLGFDCATKTFAFSLSRVDLGAYTRARARLGALVCETRADLTRAAALAATDPAQAAALLHRLAPAVAAAAAETHTFLQLADGETIDLFPGRADKSISSVERLRAVAQYVARRIRPALRRFVPPGEAPRVVIEFQMGANAPARTVAAALVTLFAEEDVFFVGPSLKNRVHTCEAGRYCYFAERYTSAYAAYKAHARYNFARIEEAFGSTIPPSAPALRGHIADSFMQVLGFLMYGPDDKKAAACF
jgi:hypothetical protein